MNDEHVSGPSLSVPEFGPDWQRAIDYGIDVTMLLENLARSPAERLARLQQVVEFHELLRNARPSGE